MNFEVGIRNSEFGIPPRPPADLGFGAGWEAHSKFEIQDSKYGFGGEWAAFLILNSYFLTLRLGGWR
jgi:hypothetical protein